MLYVCKLDYIQNRVKYSKIVLIPHFDPNEFNILTITRWFWAFMVHTG